MILADAMAYLQKKYELESLVDICTLTGAICVGLGEYTSGLFVNNDEMAESLIAAGNEVQERCWRMPIERSTKRKSRARRWRICAAWVWVVRAARARLLRSCSSS